MCGLVGSLQWQMPDDEKLIEKMTHTLFHRGPDAGKIVSLGPLVLGHRRLTIIDTEASANQPMTDNTGRYWIVFNGEIYNFKELRSTLMNFGHQFRTHSDTETILESWKKWGIDCLSHFKGMFAFALWDKEEQMLFLARDRLGEKPLYYHLLPQNLDGGIIFASELQALLQHPLIPKTINPKAMSQFLSLNYVLTNTSIIDQVQKLPPAHYLILRRHRQPELKQYWDLSTAFKEKREFSSRNAAAEQLQFLIDDSVKRQTVSDVPLGAFLSGGIDSSTIVAAMCKMQDPKFIQTFSIGFQEKSYSELKESAHVAKHLDVCHHTQVIHADMAALLPKIVSAMDEPFADSSMIPMYFLSQFSREKVKVCLSGDGGDELFAGYETYTADKLYHLSKHLPKSFIRHAQSMINYLPVSHQKVSRDYKLKKFLQGCSLDFQYAHYFWRTIFTDEEKQELLDPNVQQSIMQHQPFAFFQHFHQDVDTCHPLDQASYVDMKTWMVDDILVKVDRTTMAHSLEARAPFLDHTLVEFAASLPVSFKLRFFEKKHLLKLSQKAMLPKHILYRSKKGFNAPVSTWFTKTLWNLGREVTLNGALDEFCRLDVIERLWQEHLQKRKDHGLKLFGLTCLGLWLDNFKTKITQNTSEYYS